MITKKVDLKKYEIPTQIPRSSLCDPCYSGSLSRGTSHISSTKNETVIAHG